MDLNISENKVVLQWLAKVSTGLFSLLFLQPASQRDFFQLYSILRVNYYFVIVMVIEIFIPEGQTLSLLEILQIVSTVSKFNASHICLKVSSSCFYFTAAAASNFTSNLKF